MKTLQVIILSIGILALFASCQSTKQALSKQDSRHDIMAAIANDHEMSSEMLELLMNSEHGKMIMQQNEKMKMMDGKGMMMMMKDKPERMHHMMADMMTAAKGDTIMMAAMCKSMMNNPEMMHMMKKMQGNQEDMKKMKKMDH